MKKCLKLMVAFLLAGSAVKATEENKNCSVFQSGIGVTLGAGVSKGFLIEKNEMTLDSVPNSGYHWNFDVQRITKPNDEELLSFAVGNKAFDFVDFSLSNKIKNSWGFSWNLGLLAQKKLGTYTIGARWIFGSNGASSKLQYDTGKLFRYAELQGNLNADEHLIQSCSEYISIKNPKITNFVLKNKWFTSFIFELGYLINNRIQIFAGPGICFQGQKLCCINESGKSSGGISKTVFKPIAAIGARYALTQRISLGVEYQHQFLTKQSWNKVNKILSSDVKPFGTPVFKTMNNLFLITMTYMFGPK
ncbi:hypothetical protein HE1_00509 [Holospora elegans E1]|uniref:Outer membrane protein beta-barrel domain-containing protein n=1 Tax=Holospora elegans E1 TaxID=1427503 RepID=A0A023DY60_9PROT|nr:hypothetical protein [Holospora elegans]GAJ46184.1 hypothetical protein HE1_00509 [Holospora elegans E1]